MFWLWLCRFCYVAPDLVKEYAKYDSDPQMFRELKGKDKKTNQVSLNPVVSSMPSVITSYLF